jgi:putative ABC transport system permease protein
MSWYTRIANVFRARKLGEEVDDELAFHVAERTDELIAAGMSEREARKEALRRFGNYTVQKEKTRDMDMARAMESVFADLRYGLRQLRLSPGFTTVAVLSLALGLGANTAIFQLINALRLSSLPVREPSQLAAITTEPDFFTQGWYASRNRAFTYAQLVQLKKEQHAFSDVLAFGNTRFNLSRGGESRYAEALYVTANYFDLLGVAPFLGRTFTVEDDKPECGQPGVVLSYAFWQREFGSAASAVGRAISLDGRNSPIIGVAPKGFFGLEPARRFDVAVPLCADTLFANDPRARRVYRTDAWWLTIIGRLKPGWSVERASADLRGLSPAIFRETLPESYRPDAAKKYLANKLTAVSASAGVSSLRRQYENPLWILLATTGLVLLIACANLANLLLARASTREREIAVRQALGASRLRLIGQLLSESVLLAALGGALGALLAQALSRAIVAFLDNGTQTIHVGLGLDWHVFAFTAALALLTCVLFGLAPAIRAARSMPGSAMKAGRGAAATAGRSGMRTTLVVAQIALSLVLLVGALLFGRSLRNLLATDTGMNSTAVLVASIDAKLPNLQPERRRMVFEQLEQRIETQPGVVSVGRIWLSPFSGAGWNQSVTAEGKDAGAKKEVWMNRTGPGYFRTMRIPLLAGRDFDRHDDIGAPKVAIVNEAFAKAFFNGANPVGRTFRVEEPAGKPDLVFQIVGLVKNTKYSGVREEFRNIAFFPLNQDPEPSQGTSFMVRTSGPANEVMAGVRGLMAEVNSGLLVEFRFLELEIQRSLLRERLMANLSGAFGLLAGLLSALGLYGVMCYMVARRRSEIGVRMAMGATYSDILGLVFREAGRLVAIGLVIGVACSVAVSRYAESLLFGLKPNDALTVVAACALLLVTALIAILVPARRALRLDPSVALREE